MNCRFRDKSLTLRERIEDLLGLLTLDEKIEMLSSHQFAVERLGIGEWFVGCEAARGFVSREEGEISTVFPQPVGMASTFDKALMRKIGEIAGDEARYYFNKKPVGKLMLWGPTVDMERNPLWGRTEEAYGEDTCLAGEMTREYTIGMAGGSRADEPADKPILDCRTDENGVLLKTIPTLKHFCANNNEENRTSCNSNVTAQLLHEYYYRAFMPALKEGGAHSAMAAYNKIGGVPGDMNPDIQKVLKDKWGMDFAVTDGGAFSQNVTDHKFVRTHGEALAMCIKNGMDTMTDDSGNVSAAARDALKKGLITEKDIDKAVGNVLLGRFRLGEFDGEHRYSHIDTEPDSEYARSINLRASLEQVCLLKNDGVLPLDASAAGKVLCVGPIADENYRDWYTGTASYAVSVKSGLEKKLGKENVLFDNGWDIVAVRSKLNGKYLSVSDDGTAAFSAETVSDREKFELHDWDSETFNFRSLFNNKFLSESGTYKADSHTPYAWFIREWFKAKKCGEYYYFDSWHDDAVYMNASGELSVRRKGPASEDRLFEIEIISSGRERIESLSANADTVLFCGGNHPMQIARECYDRKTLALPPHQHDIVMSIPEKKLIFAVISSYPYAIAEEARRSPAVIYSTHCGAELGNALAEVIFGGYNPAARCPLTWYSDDSQVPDINDYDIIGSKATYLYYDGKPLFAFGHGLSYSDFEYSDLDVIPKNDHITVNVRIKNVSDYDGDEVVQIYYKGSREYQNPRLCGFERVNIPAGGEKAVCIDIPYERISEYDGVFDRMRVTEGEYTFLAAAASDDIRLRKTVAIRADEAPAYTMGSFISCTGYSAAHGAELDFSIAENDRFVRFNDWGGSAAYLFDIPEGACRLVIYAAAPHTKGKITVFDIDDGENELGSAEIPPSAAQDDFAAFEIPLSSAKARRGIRICTQASLNTLKFALFNS